ncbi:MAG: hypothetical protein ACLUAR_20180 [Pilosibacter sp.]
MKKQTIYSIIDCILKGVCFYAITRKLHTYTIDDIYDLPEGHRAELIDGQIYDMAPPSARAPADCLLSCIWRLQATSGDHNGACEVIPAPFAVFLHDADGLISPTIWSLISA